MQLTGRLRSCAVLHTCFRIRSRSSMSDLLGSVRKNQTLLVPVDNREIGSFMVSMSRPMGLKRASGKRSFVDSVLTTLDDFYGDVVQHLREWQPAAPKLPKSEVVEVEATPEAPPTVASPRPQDAISPQNDPAHVNTSSESIESGK